MNSKREKIKSYLIELTIVTMGVLFALFLSNIKEDIQARKYHRASIKTINDEIISNHTSLKGIVEQQTNLLDTLIRYTEDSSSIADLFRRSHGLQFSTIHNAALEFYKRNQMDAIDFEMMSTLINMNFLSEIIDNKLDKFSEFIYSNAYSRSMESKMIVVLHLQDVLNTEQQLLQFYENFIDQKIDAGNHSE